MSKNPNQRIEVPLDKLNDLREKVRLAYFRKNEEELKTPNNKQSPYYTILSDDILISSKAYISEGTLLKFFNDDSNRKYELETIEIIKGFINKYISNDEIEGRLDILQETSKLSNLFEEVENYLNQRIKIIYEGLIGYEPKLVSLTKDDLRILKKLEGLNTSIGFIHWDTFENIMDYNKDIIKGYKLVTAIDETIAGFYILIPINTLCEDTLNEGKLTNTDMIDTKYLCKDFKSASAIYISIVYGIGFTSKIKIFKFLKDEIISIISQNPNINTIYVRPTTEVGKINAMNNKFVKFKNSEGLYYLKPQELIKNMKTFN